MKNTPYLFLFLVFALNYSCQQPTKQAEVNLPDIQKFEDKIDGQEVSLYHLKGEDGIEVALTNFGARIVSLLAPDKEGNKRDVVLGFDKGGKYYNKEEPFYGTIVGPYANRIAKAQFTLNDSLYHLEKNDGPNTLHGGFEGLHFLVWDAEVLSDKAVRFTCNLKDGQEGFPGNRTIKVTYSLTAENELTISYEAETDQPTVINLSNHAYFNLNGEGSGSILDHKLQIFSDKITPVDSLLIPTGEYIAVENTPFDFRELKGIGRDIDEKNKQLSIGKGYDHNFVLQEDGKDELKEASKLIGDQSGIVMEMYTEEPGLQFYSGNFMSDKVTLKSGKTDSYRTALALEPQHFPDSPNHPSFPSTELQPKEKIKSTSVYRFSVTKE